MKELKDENLSHIIDELSVIYQETLHVGMPQIFDSEGPGFPRDIPSTIKECVERFDKAHDEQVARTNSTLDRIRALLCEFVPIRAERNAIQPEWKNIKLGRINGERALVSLKDMLYQAIGESTVVQHTPDGICVPNTILAVWRPLVPAGNKIQIIEEGGYTYEAVLDGAGRWMREI